MANETSIEILGDLTKPATLLVEKISNAIGVLYEPHRIVSVAKAEAKAEQIKALAQIETDDLSRRALCRLAAQERMKQVNFESIGRQALPLLKDDADPQNIEDDWITNYVDKCSPISDQGMQKLWAHILSGEANSPGSFSRRTVNLLGSLDKHDTEVFTRFCGFCWELDGDVIPLVYDKFTAFASKDYTVKFDEIRHLSELGLLCYESSGGYYSTVDKNNIMVKYFGTTINIEFKKSEANELRTGNVLLTQVGEELASICGPQPIPGFVDYVIARWMKDGLNLSSPIQTETQ